MAVTYGSPALTFIKNTLGPDMIHEPTTERLIYLLIVFAFPMFHLIKIYI